MSKLSVTHLLDAMQSLQGGRAMAVSPRSKPSPLSVEKLASFLDAPPASAKTNRLGSADLAQAVRQSFDLEQDRIIADPINLLDLPTVPVGRRLRIDAGHQLAGDGRRQAGRQNKKTWPATGGEAEIPCTAAESLATAMGVALARDVLHRSHWIVVVVDAFSALSAACEEPMKLLALQPRVLIVWCEADLTAEKVTRPQHAQSLEGLLAHSGLSHLGPLSGMTCDDLVTIFQALKMMGRASLVRVRMGDGWSDNGSPAAAQSAVDDARGEQSLAAIATAIHDDGTVTRPLAAEATPEAIESVLGEVAMRDPRVVLIDRRAEAVCGSLSDRLGRHYVAAPNDGPPIWQWCAGLVAGGCRPVLLISEQQWLDSATALAALPDGIELRATAVVFADRQGLFPSPEKIGFLPETTVAAASDLRDFEKLLSASLTQEGLIMIWAPAARPQSDRDQQLRFDPAEADWFERQRRAGQAEHQQILDKRFSGELAPWIAGYEQVGRRGGYIWKWCLHGVELTTLDCVPPSWRAHARDTKVLAGMLNVLFDDLADEPGRGDLLAELLKLIHDQPPQLHRFATADRRYGEFTGQVWSEFWDRAQRYPCYEPYAALLQFDLAQLFNTVRYSHLVNSNPYILNLVEHDDYSPQGMGLLSFAMIDLMCSPEFSVTDLGRLREAMWHAQWMARIGNLVTTWQREVKDRDYSSGVFAHAVANLDLTVQQLLTAPPAQIAAAIVRGGQEAYYLRRWKQHREHLQRLSPQVTSVDLNAMVRGLDRLLQTELVSRGEK